MSWKPRRVHLYTAAKSAFIRRATAWCFSGPALFSKVMSRARNPSPETADVELEF